MKILIAVPTYETIYPDTFKSIYDLESGGHELVFNYIRGYDVATARNNIAFKLQQENADYVLMIDNDMVIPKNALVNLLDDEKDVCLGYYAHRGDNNLYDGEVATYKIYDPQGEKYFNYTADARYTAAQMKDFRESGTYKIQIHGAGMGCALIKASVFDKIKYPWFKWVHYNDKGSLSEDLYFCEQCRLNNIPIYTDTRVGCGHIFRHVQYTT